MEHVQLIPVEKLFPSSANVRLHVVPELVQKLAEDIALRGLIHPLVVRPEGDGYGVVCGRMRLEAIKMIQREKPDVFEKFFVKGIPCVVKEMTDREAVELSLSENIRQNSLTPEEVGRGLAKLYEMGLTEEEISTRMQVELDEIKRFVRLYARLREIAPIVAESKPGRPSLAPRKRVSRTGITKVVRAVEELAYRGVISDPDSVVKQIADAASKRGLSTSELDILARKLREQPDLAREPERVIEEISSENMVERIVLLKRHIINYIDEYARSNNMTFNEALNKIIEDYLALKGVAA